MNRQVFGQKTMLHQFRLGESCNRVERTSQCSSYLRACSYCLILSVSRRGCIFLALFLWRFKFCSPYSAQKVLITRTQTNRLIYRVVYDVHSALNDLGRLILSRQDKKHLIMLSTRFQDNQNTLQASDSDTISKPFQRG